MSQKVLITGATGGIGFAIAKAFIANGDEVCISGSSDEKLQNLSKEIGAKCFLKCNLKDFSEVENLCEKASQMLGGLDVVVCNAGITNDKISIKMSVEDFQEVLNINLTANFILNKAATRLMAKNKYGRIINMASIIGQIGNIGQVNYSASKGGLISMTKSFAREYAKKGVTVNAVAPGFVETPMTSKMTEETLSEMLKSVPIGRQGKPEEVAHAVLFLASPMASYITGTTININGGMLMV